MFEELSERLEGVIRRLGGRVVLNEDSIRESLREIRKVMLEADVNFRLVQDFLKKVEEKALGREVIKSVSPGQMLGIMLVPRALSLALPWRETICANSAHFTASAAASGLVRNSWD